MLRWQIETQRACEALEWLVVETKGGDDWGCHLVFRGDAWGVAWYRDEFCEDALAYPELFARSIIRTNVSEARARAMFGAAPELSVQRLGETRVGSLVMWPGQRWLMGDACDQIVLWDLDRGEQISQMDIDAICRDGYPYFKLALAPDELVLATGDGIRGFALWDLTEGAKLAAFAGHSEEVHGIAFAGDRIISGSGDSTLRLWDRDGNALATLQADPIYCLARRPQGGLTAAGGSNGNGGAIVLVDDTLQLVRRITTRRSKAKFAPLTDAQVRVIGAPAHRRDDANIVCLAWHPDGRHLISGGWDYVLKMWDTTTGKCVRQWIGHSHWVTSCAITSDGKRLVSGSSDGRVRVWAVDEPVCLAAYECPSQDVFVDGDRIYVATTGIVQLP